MLRQLVEENKKLKGTVDKNQTVILEQAKKVTEKELESAKKAYKEAYDAGDSDAVLAAQETLTSAKIKADKLENFKVPPLQERKYSCRTG
jgi:putative cell wall-binding protein